jgi:hypothetical protein
MSRLADTHLFSSRICLALLTLITVHGSSVRVSNFRLLVGEGLTGMYGPPLRHKRNVRMSQVGLRKCIRPLLE